ncbi:glycosyltransferase-like protein [Methylobacterium sp. BE186]|uniref:MSMEG_0565 family glycosyltransferase n=1 Tax=Methylobacterium sp. BE186 TaxID=2817715 RepID=UPI002857AEC5|nr:MSMEG_0565 family glycosyltransferase [Methylobacterium sp. BE186]MDR7039640.1 glycosyltransferase-like protein [Methylobacterium sp. BE186]
MAGGPSRIAILATSTSPRGSVAHALAVGEALCDLGHEAVVHAPDPTGRGFYRDARCPVVSVAARPVGGATADLVRARIEDYLRHFATPAACDFDVFHAQCGIGGNALATLSRRRLVHGFVRTVHHLETFADPQLAYWQDRAIFDANRLLCVDRASAEALAHDHGVMAQVVGNGVDQTLFRPAGAAEDEGLRLRWGLGAGPVVLCVGGFEERRNSLAVIEAFRRLRTEQPQAQLLVVGGGSILDHAGYQARCRAALDRASLGVGIGRAVIQAGIVPQAEMPAIYRLADVLAAPALRGGFGPSVLEAMACGIPVVGAARPPFTESLAARDAHLVDPEDAEAIAQAFRAVLDPAERARLAEAGRRVASLHGWAACASRHLSAYAACSRRDPATADA